MKLKRKLAILMLCMVFSSCVGGVNTAHATGTGDGVLGQVALFGFGFAPLGWVECDGRSLLQSQNSALYAILNQTFGGDSSHFNIPDLRNASPIPGAKYYMNTQGFFGWADDPENITVVGEVILLPDRVVYIEGNSSMDFTDIWMKCDGRSLDESIYSDLYNTIGDKYGIDANGFKIPNLSDASPLAGASYYIAITGQVNSTISTFNGVRLAIG